MDRFTRHPRLMKHMLKTFHSSTTFMTITELANRSEVLPGQASRFIAILEAHGYIFRRRLNASGVTEYRLIVEPIDPRTHRVKQLSAGYR